ncbi:MAG: YdcF family protein [Oscillospiraceae bacterium]|nr:YdcF family protein [Oscillospiraceae bacterium]MBQ4000401.1 YdcF family protein [Oscillospiraceae bacterium]MBQ5412988.1 YdcF family protein [Oscillospiraceae bacterium]
MKRNKPDILKTILIIAGAAASLYGLTVISIIGTGAIFNFFYLGIGLFLLAVGSLWKRGRQKKLWQKVFLIAVCLCGVIFLSVETAIITCSMQQPAPGADYAVLLGTQYRDDGPSVDYRARLMAAYEYLNGDPECILVATGGKGSNEPCSEAEGARRFLTAIGIREERILIEDRSRNTVQNIQNAYELLTGNGAEPEKIRIVIVSASYHLLRARFLAKQAGFVNVEVKGSTGLPVLMPHFYTREFFALIKDFAMTMLDR